MITRWGTVRLLLALLPPLACAHPGGLDDNGGHFDRGTGQYHCHRAGCVLPDGSQPTDPPPAATHLTIASFNIKWLGFYHAKQHADLAKLLQSYDVVLVQELVAPPVAGTYPDGSPYGADRDAASFVDDMTSSEPLARQVALRQCERQTVCAFMGYPYEMVILAVF